MPYLLRKVINVFFALLNRESGWTKETKCVIVLLLCSFQQRIRVDERNKMCYCVIIMLFSTENQGGRKKQNVLLCYYYVLFNRESGWMKETKCVIVLLLCSFQQRIRVDERNKMCYCVIIMLFSTENQGG